MPHVRTQIRNTGWAKLLALTTVSASNIHKSRVYPLEVAPAVSIFTGRDVASEEDPTLGGLAVHNLQVVVEILSKKVAGYDDEVDAVCAEIEALFFGDPTWGGLLKTIWLDDTDPELSGESEKPVAKDTMVWIAQYRIAADDPTVVR